MLADVGAIVLALVIISVGGHQDCFPMKKWKVDQAVTRALRKAADGYGVGSILGAIYDEVEGFQEQHEETETVAAYRCIIKILIKEMRRIIGDQTMRLKAMIEYDRVWGGLLDYAEKCEIVNKYRQDCALHPNDTYFKEQFIDQCQLNDPKQSLVAMMEKLRSDNVLEKIHEYFDDAGYEKHFLYLSHRASTCIYVAEYCMLARGVPQTAWESVMNIFSHFTELIEEKEGRAELIRESYKQRMRAEELNAKETVYDMRRESQHGSASAKTHLFAIVIALILSS
uniref:Uncharacterized protein n=2 Tax=Parascaris univalens TaxID=6257 RepID=A0A915BVC7_PARUN